MPFTINGIGTHYYGKKNAQIVQGFCDRCKKLSQLESYETGLYFVVLYLPILPLGRKQIIDCCSQCSYHRVMSAGQWLAIKTAAIESSLEQLAQKPADFDSALAHLYTLSSFGEASEALELADAMEQQFATDGAAQFQLASWFERHGHTEMANRGFRRAYELAPDEPSHIRAQAMTLIEQGELDKGRELLLKLAPPSPGFDGAVFAGAADAFLTQDRPSQALELFRIAQNDPDIAANVRIRKQMRRAEKLAPGNAV